MAGLAAGNGQTTTAAVDLAKKLQDMQKLIEQQQAVIEALQAEKPVGKLSFGISDTSGVFTVRLPGQKFPWSFYPRQADAFLAGIEDFAAFVQDPANRAASEAQSRKWEAMSKAEQDQYKLARGYTR